MSIPLVILRTLCIQMRMSRYDPRPVAGFRNLRINACLPATRSLSQASHVFHRLLAPKHPPYTLSSLTTFSENLSGRSKEWRFCIAFRNSVFNEHERELIPPSRHVIQPRHRAADSLAVEVTGFEPATFWLQTRRSPS